MSGLDRGYRVERAAGVRRERHLGDALAPEMRRGSRAERLGDKPLAAVTARRREPHDGVARDPHARQQRLQGELRMARSSVTFGVARDHRPGWLVKLGVETG